MTQTVQRSDADLKRAIVQEIEWTPSVNSVHIGVSVDNGAVTLSGQVSSYPEKHLAEQAALRVHGVNVVAEELSVKSSWAAVTDADIAREANESLHRAVDLPADNVHVIVHDHQITLCGSVPWQYQSDAAHRAVRYIRGVTNVSNEIGVKPTATAAGIGAAIKEALVRSAELDSKRIAVTAEGGAVTLEGAVASWSERRQANTVAWSAPGVVSVTDRLRVTT